MLLTFSSDFSQFHPIFGRVPELLSRPPYLYTRHKATEEGLSASWHQGGSNMSEGATFLLSPLSHFWHCDTTAHWGGDWELRYPKLQEVTLFFLRMTSTNWNSTSSLQHESGQVSGSLPHKHLWYWETCIWHKHQQCVFSSCSLLCINSLLCLHSTALQLSHKSGLLCVFSILFWARSVVFLLLSLTHSVFYSFLSCFICQTLLPTFAHNSDLNF